MAKTAYLIIAAVVAIVAGVYYFLFYRKPAVITEIPAIIPGVPTPEPIGSDAPPVSPIISDSTAYLGTASSPASVVFVEGTGVVNLGIEPVYVDKAGYPVTASGIQLIPSDKGWIEPGRMNTLYATGDNTPENYDFRGTPITLQPGSGGMFTGMEMFYNGVWNRVFAQTMNLEPRYSIISPGSDANVSSMADGMMIGTDPSHLILRGDYFAGQRR